MVQDFEQFPLRRDFLCPPCFWSETKRREAGAGQRTMQKSLLLKFVKVICQKSLLKFVISLLLNSLYLVI